MDGFIEGFRVSPQQKRLLDSGDARYKTSVAVKIRGALDTERLHDALGTVIVRHEILRTAYQPLPGMDDFVQVIAEGRSIDVDEVDVGAIVDGRADAERWIAEHLRNAAPFDLERGDVFRVSLFRIAVDEYLLALSGSAIAIDARSATTMVRDIAHLYGSPSHAPAETIQYADFAEWRHAVVDGEEGRRGLDHWAVIASGTPSPARLAYEADPGSDRAPPAHVDIADAIGPATALADHLEARPADVALAAWVLLLWRMTGRHDALRLEIYAAGRKHAHLRDAVGSFGQYLPVLCHLAEDLSFRGLVDVLRQSRTEAARFEDTFGTEQTSPSAHRFGFADHEWPGTIAVPGVAFQIVDLDEWSDAFKIEMVCHGAGPGGGLVLRYSRDVYGDADIAQLARSFVAILSSLVARPDTVLGAIPIVDATDRLHLLGLASDGSGTPSDICLHELFEAQVGRTPDALAVRFEDEGLSYRDLNAQANALAGRLRERAIGPDHVVGLLVDRSVEMIASLLGILKAGAAYLPLDVGLPKARLAAILRDAGATHMLSTRDRADAIPEEIDVVFLDDERHDPDRPAAVDRPSNVVASNLAYVIFTSGSTGGPKGVAVEHRQIVAYVEAVAERLGLKAMRSFATVSTLAADLGHTAIFPALCFGATLHVIARERAGDAEAFAAYLDENPIDVLKIVPAQFAALVAGARRPHAVFPCKRLVLGGEALTLGTMRVFQSYARDCRIFNHYGPTETTVGVVSGDAAVAVESAFCKTVPLGRPLRSAAIFILDSTLQPVPVGVPGEVYIAGDGVARGYVGRPGLTAERFVPHPFADRPGARLYRSGDLARHLPDGAIEWLGRLDRQVKIRGYRVELGEIETLLRCHSAVHEAVVALNGEVEYMRLIAYVVAPDADSTLHSTLETMLAANLPDYMVPSNLVFLDTPPLTSNGKTDYRALPDPERVSAVQRETFVAPRTETEATMAAIFATLLGAAQVGIDDDFFEIGGHSLLATRLLARVRDVFSADVSLRSIFEASTVAGLSAIVDATLAEAREQRLSNDGTDRMDSESKTSMTIG